MPFTLSHPAIVLPLISRHSKWFSTTGLVVGSLIPDFEYFLRMKIQSLYSHTLPGLFFFDLPLALVVCFLFHTIIRDSLLDNLPHFLKSRLSYFQNFAWINYFKQHAWIVVFSIIIGTVSHLLWDAFTHETGFFVLKLTYLQHHLSIGHIDIPVYKICQHTSTLIGALCIGIFIFNLKKANALRKSKQGPYWFLILAVVIIIVLLRLLFAIQTIHIGDIIVTALAAIFLALMICPFLLQLCFWSTINNKE